MGEGEDFEEGGEFTEEETEVEDAPIPSDDLSKSIRKSLLII